MIWPFTSVGPPDELIKSLEDPDPDIRREAFLSLKDHTDQKTDFLIIEALRFQLENPSGTLIPLIDLIGYRSVEEGLGLLKDCLAKENFEVRLAALRALIRIPVQESLDILVPLLGDPDNTIRREVRIAIQNFGENSLGALIRRVPTDRNSPLYFEVVSLLEEMGLFEKMIEGFKHPDPEVKKFHFHNMIHFHRPEFVPLFLALYDSGGSAIQAKIREALQDYSPDEIIPHLQGIFRGSPTQGLVRLAEHLIQTRFSEAKEDFLAFISGIPQNEYRLNFLLMITKKFDPTLFLGAIDLLDDPFFKIRTLVADTLIGLFRATSRRISDPQEEKRDFLRDLCDQWCQKTRLLLAEKTSVGPKLEISRLLFAMAEKDHAFILPSMKALLGPNYSETIKALSTLSFDDQASLLEQALENDPSIAQVLIPNLVKSPTPDILRNVLKNFAHLHQEARDQFRKGLLTKGKAFQPKDFLDDPDPDVRLWALHLLSEQGGDSLFAILESRIHDPAPEVRRKVLECLPKTRHPNINRVLEDAATDPDPLVALEALKTLKGVYTPEKFASLLARFVHSPAEETRIFALREIAKITQKRFVENFDSLPRNIRKLAGSALLKLDASFMDHLIGELRSLDPESRLKSALIMETLQVGGRGKEALLNAMKDPSKKVRAAVVKTLGLIGDRSLFGNLIEFLNDPDERVRANTIEAISSVGDSRAVQILLPFLEDANNRVRANAALALWQIGKVNILPVLSKMLANRDSLMRASALWVLGEIKGEGNITLILQFTRDLDPLVRLNALKAAAKIKPDSVKPLIPALRKDPSLEIRQFVAKVSHEVL